MEKSARELIEKRNVHISLHRLNLTLLRSKINGTDQDPLEQQSDLISVVVLNTGGVDFSKDFSSSRS